MMYTLRLVKIVNQKRRLMDKIIKPMGFSRIEWQILTYLSDAKGCLVQKQLTQYIDTDQAFIARALDKLEIKKLIVRKIDPEDKRQRNIFLTPKGKPIAEKLLQHGLALNSEIMSGISKKNLDQLDTLTAKIEANIKNIVGD